MVDLSPLFVSLLLVWLAWVIQATLGLTLVRHMLRLVRRGPTVGDRRHRPPVTVICPVKGLQDDLRLQFSALCTQRYPGFRLRFVVESREDPAFELLERLCGNADTVDATVTVSGLSGPSRGQKVHNLLVVLEALDAEVDERHVRVFADADAAVSPEWLGNLVGPLQRSDSIVTSGYRWLVPADRCGGRGPSLWSILASVVNGSIACANAHRPVTQAWGGAMGLTAGTARRGGLLEAWSAALSDDFTVTDMSRRLGAKVRYVPRCLALTDVGFEFDSFVEFVYRQYLIVRVYARPLFLVGLLNAWLYVFAAASASIFAITRMVSGNPAALWAIVPMAVVFGTNQARAKARRACVVEIFGKAVERRLHWALLVDRWATPLWTGVNALMMLIACFGSTIEWRGIRYRLRGKHRVERLDAGHA